MLNFALCDDNIIILNRLVKSLESIFIRNNINAEICLKASNPNDILDFIENNTVDVLILDINLKSAISGCDIADIVRKKNKDVYIIFLTGHLEYALVAYKYKTFDYLPKPISDERLEETVLRLIEDTKNANSHFLKLSNNTLINENNINFIRKEGMKLVFCTNTHNYETYSSFSKIEHCLPDNFIRCHKSFIVNVNNVAQFDADDNLVLFDHGMQCSVGAKYRNKFLEVFEDGNSTNYSKCVNK